MKMLICPNCEARLPSTATYCDHCGVELVRNLEPDFPLNPCLTIPAYDNAKIPLPSELPKYLIGRKDPSIGCFPDVDLVPFGGEEGGVSRRHARIIQSDGEFFIEDLDSVNYTFINSQKLEPGKPYPIRDGDELRLGRIKLVFGTG